MCQCLKRILLVVLLALLSGCSKTVGSHTLSEQQRLSKLHSHLAFEFLLNNNVDVAMGEAQEAIRLNSYGVESNHAMARVHESINQFDRANRHYLTALRSDPYDVVVLNDYGHFLCQRGKIEHAFEKFDTAGSQLMNPQRMVSYTRAASCAINNQKLEQAETYLLRALELNPESQAVLLNLAQVNVDKNNFNQARNYLARYLLIATKPSKTAIKLATKLKVTI